MTNGHDPSVKLNGNHEDMPDEWPEKPVALVNSVSPASPAAQAVSLVLCIYSTY